MNSLRKFSSSPIRSLALTAFAVALFLGVRVPVSASDESGVPGAGSLDAQTPVYTVTYGGNGNTSGTPPTDNNAYTNGATVTVLANAGIVARTGYNFAGWNTAPDGGGTSYAATGSATFTMGSSNVTLYALWAPVYTVVYNGNNNTSGTPPTDNITYANGATVTVLANPGIVARAGYNFGGWNTAPDGSGTSYAATGSATFTMGSSNVTLYALWAPVYTVVYNGNNNTSGTVPTDNNIYPSGATVTVLRNAGIVARTGYNFAGWNTAPDGSGTSYAATGSATFTMGSSNVTLYALWAPVYTVVYNGNNNTSGTAPTDNNLYPSGATVTVLRNAGIVARTGYNFTGWNTAPDGGGTRYAATGSATFTMGSANVTLYAQWETNHTVTYRGNGNTGGFVPTDNNTYSNGTTVTVQANTGALTRTGYTLTGWSTATNGAGINYATTGNDTFTMGSSDVILYAQWTPVYIVVYNGNKNTGGTIPADSGTYTNGATVTVLANTGNLTKTGYAFAGWNTTTNGTGTGFAATGSATFTMGSSNVVLYAQWVPGHTVTYSGNSNTGGSVPADNTTYSNGATVTVRSNTGNLTRTGYAFVGWNTAQNGSGTSYAATGSATFLMGSANVTLYAQWVTAHTVTYNGNSNTGGSSPTDRGAYTNGATVIVLSNTGLLTRSGYTFAGWNTAKNGNGTSYAATGSATLMMGSANVTLYTQWVTAHLVTYNGNGNTGGTIPTDNNPYTNGATVTVLSNTGNLTRTGYAFTGWNTAASGTGTNYAASGSVTFKMGANNVILYSVWRLLPATGTNITFAITGGNQLSMNWPTNYIGWELQSNSVNIAASSFWYAVPGSAATNSMIIPIDSTKPGVFYRMHRP